MYIFFFIIIFDFLPSKSTIEKKSRYIKQTNPMNNNCFRNFWSMIKIIFYDVNNFVRVAYIIHAYKYIILTQLHFKILITNWKLESCIKLCYRDWYKFDMKLTWLIWRNFYVSNIFYITYTNKAKTNIPLT